MSWLARVFGKRNRSKADAIVAGVAPMVGHAALSVLVGLIPSNFGLRDLGGGQQVSNPDRTRDAMAASLRAHDPVTPYLLVDLFRELGLVVNEPGGLALIDRALAEALSAAAQSHSGPTVSLAGFEPESIRQDRLRFSYQQIAQNAAAIADRWSD